MFGQLTHFFFPDSYLPDEGVYAICHDETTRCVFLRPVRVFYETVAEIPKWRDASFMWEEGRHLVSTGG